MSENEGLMWYAYRHINGATQVKRFFGKMDLQDCEESDFVESYTQPYRANGRDEALKRAGELLGD